MQVRTSEIYYNRHGTNAEILLVACGAAPSRDMRGDERHVDLIQLVDAQEAACTELVGESLASMRELLQQPGARGVSVKTAARQHLDAQFEHLRAFLREERNKLEQTLAGDHGESSLQGCTGARSDTERLGSDHEERSLVWWSRQFRSTYLEHAYRQHHIEAWRTRIRISSVVGTAIILFRTVNSFRAVLPGAEPLWCVCTLDREKHRPPHPLHFDVSLRPPPFTQADVDAGIAAGCGRLLRRLVLLDPYAHAAHVRFQTSNLRLRVAARPARPSTRPAPSRPIPSRPAPSRSPLVQSAPRGIPAPSPRPAPPAVPVGPDVCRRSVAGRYNWIVVTPVATILLLYYVPVLDENYRRELLCTGPIEIQASP